MMLMPDEHIAAVYAFARVADDFADLWQTYPQPARHLPQTFADVRQGNLRAKRGSSGQG